LRRLVSLALIALAAACEAPVDESAAPAAGIPDTDPNAFRAERDAEERAYAGEWATDANACNNQREIWTIEQTRMGMKRERFCHFERVNQSAGDEGQVWSASARCVARGRTSNDFVFFRVNPSKLKMRVTINDSESVELIRCPMRT
jgi:hypothetical protein